MAFDPSKPADHAEILSAELREQFNALNERIGAVESALAAAIAGTAINPVSVGPFSTSLSDPPSAAQVQAILDVHNQLVSALTRT